MANDPITAVSRSHDRTRPFEWLTNRPYVYHVRAFDPEGLKAALKSALATPIGSYIPPYMRFAQVCEYTATVLNGDWRGKAEEILEERKAEGGKVSRASFLRRRD